MSDEKKTSFVVPMTGYWFLNHADSDSQVPFLKAWGRRSIEQKVIDAADEFFLLFHCIVAKPGDQTIMHCFSKHVRIELFDGILKKILSKVRSTSVHYQHDLKCNNKELKCPNDEKEFGDCFVKSHYHKKSNEFILMWFLPNCKSAKHAILRVTHWIRPHKTEPEKEQLVAYMQLFRSSDGKTFPSIDFQYKEGDPEPDGIACKVYDRIPLTEKLREYTENHKWNAAIVGKDNLV